MSRKYKFGEKKGAYFISFASVNGIDVFTRELYFSCITESLDYCRKEKGMEIQPFQMKACWQSTLFYKKTKKSYSG